MKRPGRRFMTIEFLLVDLSLSKWGEFRESLCPHLLFSQVPSIQNNPHAKEACFRGVHSATHHRLILSISLRTQTMLAQKSKQPLIAPDPCTPLLFLFSLPGVSSLWVERSFSYLHMELENYFLLMPFLIISEPLFFVGPHLSWIPLWSLLYFTTHFYLLTF